MATYKTPGVYIEEVSLLPPSVAQVETAIPAFIGYTASGTANKPVRIRSMAEYVTNFGGPANNLPSFTVTVNAGVKSVAADDDLLATPAYRMYYALQLYFSNGGGPCYVVSAGAYKAAGDANDDTADFDELNAALSALRKEDEPTLLVIPDASMLDDADDYHNLYANALQQCADLQDRFTICDVLLDGGNPNDINAASGAFRDKIGTSNLKYGAAYYPSVTTTLGYSFVESKISVTSGGTATLLRYLEQEFKAKEAEMRANGDSEADIISALEDMKEASLFHQDNEAYFMIRNQIEEIDLVLPVSSAMAGVYASVDNSRGVWKAPANISLRSVKRPTVVISHNDQQDLNVHSTGKSINAIRFFSGKGNMVWGARTLAGNDNEWRYISVRRFYNMVEESVKKASDGFVFEPNDANTWTKIKAMIENFLTLQWRAGALMGATTEQAFFVKVGLGTTMTSLDVLEGRMIVEIGMAVVRPAEFIILRFSHKMMEA